MPDHTLARRLAAEAIGTLLLVATVVGSGIMAQNLTTDGALALLANTLPTGAILIVLITILAPVSGAHFNPAVTMVTVMMREMPLIIGSFYIAAQFIGGAAGTILAHAMFAQDLIEISSHARTGPSQWLSEAVATFGLVVTIIAGRRANRAQVPMLVGLYITAAYWFTASTSFANPAVTVARALTESFSGISPADVPMFIVAQIVGAIIGMLVINWMLGRDPQSIP